MEYKPRSAHVESPLHHISFMIKLLYIIGRNFGMVLVAVNAGETI